MTTEEHTHNDVKKLIANLPLEIQVETQKHIDTFEALVKEHGAPVMFAIAFMGSKLAAEAP